MMRRLLTLALLCLSLPVRAAEEAPVEQLDLLEAYQREHAFVAGQKRELRTRLDAARSRQSQELKTAEQSLDALQTELLALEARAQKLREALTAADEAATLSVDGAQQLEGAAEQARTTLSEHDIALPPGDEPTAALEAAFAKSVPLLAQLSRQRQGRGEFFLADGTRVEGEITRIGRIAALGHSPQGSGVLAPAGAGKLMLWSRPEAAVAEAIAAGQTPAVLPLFLFNSLATAVDTEGELDPLAHVEAGGLIAWVIVGLGLVGLLLILLRALLLLLAGRSRGRVEGRVAPLVRDGRNDEAEALARRLRGSAGRAVAATLAALRGGGDSIDEAISESMLGESRRVRRFGGAILVIAAVSPLLGLLGTVTGMIATFDVITKFGTGDPKLLSGGISTALITTELGLIVAIPTLLAGRLLSGWGDRIESEAERVVLHIVTLFRRPLPAPPAEERAA